MKSPFFARKAWYGALRGWAVPSRPGSSPVPQYSLVCRAEVAIRQSSIGQSMRTCRPSRTDGSSEAIVSAAYRPAVKSPNGTPALTGPPRRSPVTDITPLMPWITTS